MLPPVIREKLDIYNIYIYIQHTKNIWGCLGRNSPTGDCSLSNGEKKAGERAGKHILNVHAEMVEIIELVKPVKIDEIVHG